MTTGNVLPLKVVNPDGTSISGGTTTINAKTFSTDDSVGNNHFAKVGQTGTSVQDTDFVQVIAGRDSTNQLHPVRTDSNGNLKMTEDLPSTPLHGQKILATAGTAEPIVGVSTPSKAIVITALEANSGYIYVGGSTVTSSNGYILPSGGSIGEIISDLQYMYIVSEKDGDGVCYLGS